MMSSLSFVHLGIIAVVVLVIVAAIVGIVMLATRSRR
jgi:hypothetical protein